VTRFRCFLGIVICTLLVGCDQAALMKRFTPREAELAARNYVDLLRQGQSDELERDLDAGIAEPNARDQLHEMAAMFPTTAIISAKIVGSQILRGKDLSTTNSLTLEYEFPDRWLLANVVFRKNAGTTTIVGFHVRRIPDSLENMNAFTLAGKSAWQYLILVLAMCSILFSLYVFRLCIRTETMKLKWLWLFFILVGLGRLTVNWTTGDTSFTCAGYPDPLRRNEPYCLWALDGSGVSAARLYFVFELPLETKS